jgi:hypothetical protein
MNQRGFILWQKKDLRRVIWLGVLFIMFAGIVGGQIYKNRKWKQQLDKNSYAYLEGAVIRALNNPRSLTQTEYQTAKQLGIFEQLLQEHPNYKTKINRLIQIMEKKQVPQAIKKSITSKPNKAVVSKPKSKSKTVKKVDKKSKKKKTKK